MNHDGLAPLAGSTRPLGAGSAGPAQVSFSPNGKTLVVTEKASSTIDTYVGRTRTASPARRSSTRPRAARPFGFAFDKRGDVLTSDAAGSASSYADREERLALRDQRRGADASRARRAGSSRARTAATRTRRTRGSGTISGFPVGHDGSLSLLDPSGAAGNLGAGSHPLDEIMSRDGKFLHVLVDGTHTVGTFRIGYDGGLTWIGAAGTLPPGDVGLATAGGSSARRARRGW